MEDAEGDVDMVLEEEGAKIEEKERIAKEELEKELRQYRIKVRIKYYPKGRGLHPKFAARIRWIRLT